MSVSKERAANLTVLSEQSVAALRRPQLQLWLPCLSLGCPQQYSPRPVLAAEQSHTTRQPSAADCQGAAAAAVRCPADVSRYSTRAAIGRVIARSPLGLAVIRRP